MKTYEDCLKEHGGKRGLWNDPFAKTYTEDVVEEDENSTQKIILEKNKKSIYKGK